MVSYIFIHCYVAKFCPGCLIGACVQQKTAFRQHMSMALVNRRKTLSKFAVYQVNGYRHTCIHRFLYLLEILFTHCFSFSLSPSLSAQGHFLSLSLSLLLSELFHPAPLPFRSPLTGWICTCGYVRASSQPSSCSSCTISHRERGQICHQNSSA